MAQLPRGEPRSVPDPAGQQREKMIRQERLRQQSSGAATPRQAHHAGLSVEHVAVDPARRGRLPFLAAAAIKGKVEPATVVEVAETCSIPTWESLLIWRAT